MLLLSGFGCIWGEGALCGGCPGADMRGAGGNVGVPGVCKGGGGARGDIPGCGPGGPGGCCV